MKKYENFLSNLKVLSRASKEDLNNEFIKSGIIDKFFIQFELSWKVLKELLAYEGKSVAATGSPREIIKAAYTVYDFIDEKIWISMLKNRNNLTHIYDGNEADRLVQKILNDYIPAFQRLNDGFVEWYGDNLERTEE